MFLLFASLLGVLLTVYGLPVRWDGGTARKLLFGIGAMIAFVLWVHRRDLLVSWAGARRSVGPELLETVRAWFPFILLILVYENLHDLVKVITPRLVDYDLMRLDEIIFGVEPTLWLQWTIRPWLTDYMAFSYDLYFILPAVLAGILYAKGRHGDYRLLMLAMVMNYYVGFILYILVPAIGPRYILADEFDVGIQGIWLYDPSKNIWQDLEAFDRDCYPSLHAATAMTSILFAYRFRDLFKPERALFWVYLPLGASLILSTVYLRYHWAVDVLAGVGLATATFIVSPWIDAAWRRRVGPLPVNRSYAGTSADIGRGA